MQDLYRTHDATGLAQLVAHAEISPDELLETALAQVDALNPSLNAVVHVQEEVARQAIRHGLPEGPFRGVPFLLKDLGAEARDFPTNNGSLLTKGKRWDWDSEIYLRLKAAGLVTFGRTTSPEFGVGPVTEAKAYGGPTRNPWNLNHTSGGSSGGAGAAVASGIVPVAHGSDGGGSVRIPASSCGLVGFKPTRARLPRGPAAGEGWAGMAIDGFLTRSLRDTASLLDAVSGADLGAPYWAPPMESSYRSAMERDPGRLRIRVLTTTFDGSPIHSECSKAAENAGRLLESMGHHVEPYTPVPTLGVDRMMAAWTKIVACGTELGVRAALPGTTLDPAMIDGVTLGALVYARTVSGADYLAAVNEIHAFGRRLEHLFEDCDVLVSPTLAAPPARVGQLKPDNQDFVDYRNGPAGVFAYSPYTALFNASGQPAVSLPLHWSHDELPVGVHLATAFGADELLMSLSARLEQAAPWTARQQHLLDAGGVLHG